jgi:Uncharacterised protein family (UPF0175)
MPTITFEVPEGALSALRLSPTEFVKEMRVAAALLWYSHGELSQSKAAEIAGTSRGVHRRARASAHPPRAGDGRGAAGRESEARSATP